MKLLLLFDRWLARISGWLIIVFLSIMILMAFGQVVLRNLFQTGIDWADIFLRHLVLWLGFLGASLATGEGRHLKIEFVNRLAPERLRKVIWLVTHLFAALICCFLMRAAISFVQLENGSGSTLILDLPTTYFIIIIPVGYGIMALRFAVRALAWATEILKGDWQLKEEH